MQITKSQWFIAGAGIFLVVTVAYIWSSYSKIEATPVAVIDTNMATTTTENSPQNSASTTPVATEVFTFFPINTRDASISWNFKGSYAGSDVLIQQANADIAHLTALIGKGQYDDYDIYNGIANDYAHLGKGKEAYQNYNKSIRIHPKKGLAFVNLAHLMKQMGAYFSAADAFAASVQAEPGQLEYHVERVTFLTEQFPNDNARMLSALKAASEQFGDTAAILSIEAKWLTGQKRYADAIKAWETVRMLSPEDRRVAIDVEIARLQAKQ